MSSVDVLFVHGGPGLNSNPERKILSPFLNFEKISYHFWDEPSELRTSNFPYREDCALSNCLNSLNECILKCRPKVIAASSFGAQMLLHYLNRFKTDDLQILFVGPTFNVDNTFKKMMMISEKDFMESDPQKSAELTQMRMNIQKLWDVQTQNALNLTWQNPKLLSHYFVNAEVMSAWIESLSQPEYASDPKSQNAILEELKQLPSPKTIQFNGSVNLFLGSQDPVFDAQDTFKTLKDFFPSYKEETVADAGHFPHLEKPQVFIKTIKSMITA